MRVHNTSAQATGLNHGNAVDLTGRRFGRLVALRCTGSNARPGNYGLRWLFACDCGAEHEARAKDVVLGTTTSCGCARAYTTAKRALHVPIIPGAKFGRLTVRASAGTGPRGGVSRWVCDCECGNETTVRRSLLAIGQTRSCGCLAGRAGRRAAA